MILAGGRIRTLGRAGLNPQSHLAIAGGKVIACGGREVMSLRGPRTRVVDLNGSAVLPGFNDAHAHVVYYGLTRFAADRPAFAASTRSSTASGSTRQASKPVTGSKAWGTGPTS